MGAMRVRIIETHQPTGLCRVKVNGQYRLTTIAVAQRLVAEAAAPPAAGAPEPPRLAPQTSTADYSPHPLVMPAEAARMLGVCEKTVSRWCDSGRLSATRTLGQHRRITLASVQQLAEERSHGGPATGIRTAAT